MKRLETIFCNGSGKEIERATTNEKIIEMIEEMSKREAICSMGKDENGT